MKVTMNEIRPKDKSQLERLLKETREELRQLNTKAAGHDLKNVRAIRKLRLVIARVSTRLSELKASKAN